MATRKGDLAKQNITDTIIKAFGDDYEGTVDKKLYVWAQDGPGGERVQLAIAITMPKTPVTCGGSVSGDEGAWSDAPQSTPAASSTPVQTQLSTEDKEKVARLMAELGLN